MDKSEQSKKNKNTIQPALQRVRIVDRHRSHLSTNLLRVRTILSLLVLTCPSCPYLSILSLLVLLVHLVHLVGQYLLGEHHLQFVQLGHHSTWTWPGFRKSVTIIISNHIFIPCPTWTSVSVNKNMNNHHQSIKNRTRNSKVQYHG